MAAPNVAFLGLSESDFDALTRLVAFMERERELGSLDPGSSVVGVYRATLVEVRKVMQSARRLALVPALDSEEVSA